MKGQDFYDALKAQSEVFKAYGLKKKDRTSFMLPDNIRLQFLLDKWGWDDENGWSFCARLFDMKQQDKWGNVLGPGATTDIQPANLIQQGLLDERTLEEVYNKHRSLQSKVASSSWFLFYDSKELDRLLELVLQAIITYAKAWQPKPIG